jgi:hypothetical protein
MNIVFVFSYCCVNRSFTDNFFLYTTKLSISMQMVSVTLLREIKEKDLISLRQWEKEETIAFVGDGCVEGWQCVCCPKVMSHDCEVTWRDPTDKSDKADGGYGTRVMCPECDWSLSRFRDRKPPKKVVKEGQVPKEVEFREGQVVECFDLTPASWRGRCVVVVAFTKPGNTVYGTYTVGEIVTGYRRAASENAAMESVVESETAHCGNDEAEGGRAAERSKGGARAKSTWQKSGIWTAESINRWETSHSVVPTPRGRKRSHLDRNQPPPNYKEKV